MVKERIAIIGVRLDEITDLQLRARAKSDTRSQCLQSLQTLIDALGTNENTINLDGQVRLISSQVDALNTEATNCEAELVLISLELKTVLSDVMDLYTRVNSMLGKGCEDSVGQRAAAMLPKGRAYESQWP